MSKNAENEKQNSKDKVLALLKDKAVREELTKALNDQINLPFLNEDCEQKIFESLYDTIVVCLDVALNKEEDNKKDE